MDSLEGLTPEAYVRISERSNSRLFDLSFTHEEDVEAGNFTFYFSATQEDTLAAHKLSNAAITFQFIDDDTGERFIVAHGGISIGSTALPDVALSTDISSLTEGDTALLNSLINEAVADGGGVTIADNLTTNESDEVLSAAQGVALKSLIDGKATSAQGTLAYSALQPSDNISDLTNDSGFITGYTVTEGDVTSGLDGATLSDAGTPASDDKVLVQDTSDGDNLKYVAFSEFGGGGGVDWTTTQDSSKADGASNSAFELNTTNTFSLGKLLSISNNSTEKFSVDASGGIFGASLLNGAYGQVNIGNSGKSWAFTNGGNGLLISPSAGGMAASYIGGYDHNQHFTQAGLTVDGGTSLTSNYDGGDLTIKAGTGTGTGSNGNLYIIDIPTSDPVVAGAIWDDNGTLKRSAG